MKIWHATQVAVLVDSTGGRCRAELLRIISALKVIEQDAKKDLDCRGWVGNMTGAIRQKRSAVV
ncbi:MAG: hypothetical protein P8R42_16945 [Candidatus Binatia bacterium]|nr:hypothetical protein [Candidatus Binatia bacterium]